MATEPKTYRLRITFSIALVSYGLPAFFVLLTVVLFVTRPEGLTKSVWVMLLWIATLGYIAWASLRLPTRITTTPESEIVFSGLLGQRRIAAGSVQSISPAVGRQGELVLRHAGGRIQFINQFDNFHEFLQDLKQWNPSVQLRGC